MVAYQQQIAIQNAEYGIRSNVILPGLMDTPMAVDTRARQSGKSRIVIRRHACHPRLANAVYHWARVAVQHDPRSRLKYASLRGRGHSHARALRSVADRLLNVACAMLRAGTTFNPSLVPENAPC